MRFAAGNWVHENFKDVFVEVLKVQYQDHRKAKLRVIWWNLGWVGEPRHVPMNEYIPIFKQTIEILAKDFKHWKRLESRIRTVPEVA